VTQSALRLRGPRLRAALRRVACLALGALGAAACAPPARPPHLVLVLVDTLRADHLGAYGYPRPTSPRFDALAAQGILFEKAGSPSSWTRPAVASLFTSRLPSEHGAVATLRRLADDVPTLAEVLRAAGYRSIGVSANFPHVSEATGLARGFESFVALRSEAAPDDPDWLWPEPDGAGGVRHLRAASAEEVNAELLRRLPERVEMPLFLYAHYMEPHSGYAPPAALRERFVRDPELDRRSPPASSDHVLDLATGRRTASPEEIGRLVDLYDAEIAAADEALGRLLDALAARGIGADAVVVVVSDHGEEFGEHGGFFHGLALHRESIHVPLVIRAPGRPGGERRSDAVDLLDVPTTLLALAGATPPTGMRGRNLLGGAPLTPRLDLMAELHRDPLVERRAGPRRHLWALQRWPWKIVMPSRGPAEIYHLGRDLAERSPTPASEPGKTGRLVARLTREGQELRLAMRRPGAAPEAPLDAETRAALRALGYVE
jgi:arylsulfatase A-like enzyme